MPQDQTTQDDAGADESTPFDKKARPAAARTSEDLSPRIVAAVERKPGDVVRCTRVGHDRYRCNWWSAQALGGYDNPGMVGLLVTTHRVRKSLFLRASHPSDRLVLRIDPACSTKGLSPEDLKILPGDAAAARS